MKNVKKSIIITCLLSTSTCVLADSLNNHKTYICPPASAINYETTGKWTLDNKYETQGWHIVQKPRINNPSEKFHITDNSTLSVRLTSGGAYIPNETDDNFHLLKNTLYFQMTCSYVNYDGKTPRSIEVQTVGDFDWAHHLDKFKPEYEESSWIKYLETKNEAYIHTTEAMVCITTANNPKSCLITDLYE